MVERAKEGIKGLLDTLLGAALSDSNTRTSCSPTRQQDVNFPGLHETSNLEHPGVLAGLMSAMHGQQPGILRQLLGGGGGAQSNVAKAALAGIAAIGPKKAMGGKGLF